MTRTSFERSSYTSSNPAVRAGLDDMAFSLRRGLKCLVGVLLAVGLGWLVYLGTLEAVIFVFGEQNHVAVPITLAVVIDLALLSGICVMFFRWLGTQPNPVDS